MSNLIRIAITRTWKSYSPRAEWESYDQEDKLFSDMRAARAWLKDSLPSGTRKPMYIDTVSRGTIQCGFIVGFRHDDYSDRGQRLKHLEQWWVEFQEVRSLDIGRKRKEDHQTAA